MYSMLRSTIQAKYNINIHDYAQVIQFLKKNSKGYEVKKAQILTSEQCHQFIKEAPDDEYLAIKVALILGIQGACRKHELCDLIVDNIFDKGDMVLVKIPKTKNDKPRSFIITEDFYQIYKKYVALRPSDVESKRFFLNFKKGKCSKQVIGINTIANFPKIVATYLKLDKPENYTSHTFRRISATLLADSGASILDIQRQGGWKSSTVAASYVEDSLGNKKKFGKMIANEINNAPTTSTAHEEMHNKKRTFTAIENEDTDLPTPSKIIRINMSNCNNINLNISNCNNLTVIIENNEH